MKVMDGWLASYKKSTASSFIYLFIGLCIKERVLPTLAPLGFFPCYWPPELSESATRWIRTAILPKNKNINTSQVTSKTSSPLTWIT